MILARAPAPAPRRTLLFLGIRGLPAADAGVETFSGELARWLVARRWRVAC